MDHIKANTTDTKRQDMATHTPVMIDELFGELCLPDEPKVWGVIHTKPRCEKKLALYAQQAGIHYFLPQHTSSKIYQRRKVVSSSVMFNGYLFAILDAEAKETLSITGYVVGYIKVKDQKHLLQELQNLHNARNKLVETLPANWLGKGIEVEITEGALKGMTGVVESHNKISEVHLQVNVLRQAVLVKIDPKYVRTIGEYSAREHAE